LPSTQSNLVADGRPASDAAPAPGAARQQPLAAIRPDHGDRRGADLSLFRMAAPARVGLVLIPLALLWAAILSLVA
jgi:hypothetical protein